MTTNDQMPDPVGPELPPLPGFEGITRYWDPKQEVRAAKIGPGEFYVTVQDEMIVTVLGSCVSVCIRDELIGVGGMNHFMLPGEGSDAAGEWGGSPASVSNRYGGHAMESLINGVLSNGGERDRLELKVFGGGKILAAMTDIGKRNIAFVRNYIWTESLKLVAEDLGKVYPRKVYYFPLTGRVRVKKIRVLKNDTLITREVRYQRSLEQGQVHGEVDLF